MVIGNHWIQLTDCSGAVIQKHGTPNRTLLYAYSPNLIEPADNEFITIDNSVIILPTLGHGCVWVKAPRGDVKITFNPLIGEAVTAFSSGFNEGFS